MFYYLLIQSLDCLLISIINHLYVSRRSICVYNAKRRAFKVLINGDILN